MSSRCLQDMLSSSRCLQDVLEDAKLLLWRRVEDVLKTCLGDVFKTSSRLTNVCWVNIILESPYLGKIISRSFNYVSIKMAGIKLLQDCFMTESEIMWRSGERFERFVKRSIMIYTALKDLHYVEWFVLRWMVCSTLNDLNYVTWFVQRWIICTTLNELYYVEWFVQRWMIFYFRAKLVRPQKICTASTDLYYVEWFGVRRMIYTTLSHLGYDELLKSAL